MEKKTFYALSSLYSHSEPTEYLYLENSRVAAQVLSTRVTRVVNSTNPHTVSRIAPLLKEAQAFLTQGLHEEALKPLLSILEGLLPWAVFQLQKWEMEVSAPEDSIDAFLHLSP